MSKSISPAVIGIGLVGAYLLFNKSGTSLSSLIPGTSPSVTPTTTNPTGLYGINSGIKGGNGSFYTVSNYAQLLAANPNLGNPNYSMTDAEAQQYLSNYSDLNAPAALPSWIGKKQPDGTTPLNINDAARAHWKFDGCAEKRIFLPLVPASTAGYIPPPPQPAAKSNGGSSFLSSALSIAGTILPALLGTNTAPQLSDAELNVLFTGGAILNDILPMFQLNDPQRVAAIDEKFKDVLIPYYQ